jgi:glycine cleavage system H protein
MRINDCDFPDDRLYDVQNHTWLVPGEAEDTVGIDSVLSWISGGFTAVSFKPVGSVVRAGDSLGWVEGPRHFDVVRAPESCTLVAVNAALLSNPRLLNKDPYRAGWFAKIRRSPGESLSTLSEPSAAEPRLRATVEELRVHCFVEYPDQELVEIGVECAAVLVQLNEVLSRTEVGTVVHVVSDDPTAEIEMERWSDETRNEILEIKKEGALFHFVVKKKA